MNAGWAESIKSKQVTVHYASLRPRCPIRCAIQPFEIGSAADDWRSMFGM